MSLTPPSTVRPFIPAAETTDAPFTPHAVGRGLRLEDALRLLLAGAVVAGAGLALGGFTFHEVAGRGTGYYVVALCLAVIFSAVAYYQFEGCLTLLIGIIWIDLGQTPDLATGVSSGTGKALYPVELAILFLLFIWGVRRLSKKQGRSPGTPINRLLWIYLAFSAWTAINGYLFWDSTLAHIYAGTPGDGRPPTQVVILELALRVLSFGTFWMFASSIINPQWLRRASMMLLLPGVLVLLSYFHVLPIPASNWSLLLETSLACALFAWLLETPDAPPARKSAAILGIAIVIVQVFLLSITWISGWLSLFAGLLFVAFLKSKRLFTGLICAAIAIALCVQPFLQEKIVHKIQTSGDLDRVSMMRGAVLYAMHFPLGIGVGNYRAYNTYYGSSAVWNTSGYTSAHNFYAQALSEMGFVGLCFTITWVVGGLVMLARFYGRMPAGFSRTMMLAIAGMWAGISSASMVGDYLIPVYYNGGLGHLSTTIYAWIGLGLAVAHARRAGVLEPVSGPVLSLPPARERHGTRQYPRRFSR